VRLAARLARGKLYRQVHKASSAGLCERTSLSRQCSDILPAQPGNFSGDKHDTRNAKRPTLLLEGPHQRHDAGRRHYDDR
jgi:hypothetical protein